MYFWKIDSLKKDLVEKPLPESESFKYLLATMILVVVSMIFPSPQSNQWDVYFGIVATILAAVEVYYIYLCNKGKDGSNFLQKYLAIGWVVVVRWFFLIFIPSMILFLIALGAFSELPLETTWQQVAYMAVIMVVYILLFAHHVKDLVKMEEKVSER
jgi:hypothetical protein